MEQVRPDYGGACVSRVVPALLGPRDDAWIPQPAREAAQVVLLVLDGLGWDQLRAHEEAAPGLAGMAGGPITTVAPSTTGPALASIATGRSPGEHGITGYRMRAGDSQVFNVLSWHALDGTAGPPPAEIVPDAEGFLGRRVPVVTRAHFASSGLTKATLRGAEFFGWRTIGVLVETVRRLVAAGEPFVYAYYDGIDTVSHVHGILDEFYTAELSFADAVVERLLSVLPASAALCVTADHGQVPLTSAVWIEPGDVGGLVEAHAGDARWRYLYAHPGAAGDLAAACRERYAAEALVLTRDELIESGLLGPLAREDFRERVGDVTLIASGGAAFLDPKIKLERGMLSGHGALTAAEMRVPFVAASGTG